jgi:hypothetical protein
MKKPSIIKTNSRGEQQIDCIGRIEMDQDGNDTTITFRVPFHRTPLQFHVALPCEDESGRLEETCEVEMFNANGDKMMTLFGRVRNNGQIITFIIPVLFWSMVAIVPMPDDRTRKNFVPVYIKPVSLQPMQSEHSPDVIAP